MDRPGPAGQAPRPAVVTWPGWTPPAQAGAAFHPVVACSSFSSPCRHLNQPAVAQRIAAHREAAAPLGAISTAVTVTAGIAACRRLVAASTSAGRPPTTAGWVVM